MGNPGIPSSGPLALPPRRPHLHFIFPSTQSCEQSRKSPGEKEPFSTVPRPVIPTPVARAYLGGGKRERRKRRGQANALSSGRTQWLGLQEKLPSERTGFGVREKPRTSLRIPSHVQLGRQTLCCKPHGGTGGFEQPYRLIS